MLDHTVLAGGVHGLQHDEYGAFAVGIKLLLHLPEPGDAVGQHRLHILDIGRKAEGFRRIVVGEPKVPRLVDPAGFEDFR